MPALYEENEQIYKGKVMKRWNVKNHSISILRTWRQCIILKRWYLGIYASFEVINLIGL
jgi:hypothetical protein